MRTLPPKARFFLVSICLCGAAVFTWASLHRTLPPAAPLWEPALLALLALLAGGKKLRVIGLGKNNDQDGSLSLGFIIILAAILRGGPLSACVVALLSCLSSCLYPKRQ